MKIQRLWVLAATLAAFPFAWCQENAVRAPQRITVERTGDDVATILSAEVLGTIKPRGAAFYSNGTYRVTSSGADIWSRSDSFHFTAMLLDGDGQFLARVVSVDKTGPWAKAGLMLRDGNAADARHALLAVTPEYGFTFQYRNSAKAKTIEAIPRPVNAAKSTDGGTGWIKIVRQGNRISGYSSANGTDWLWEGTAEYSDLPAQLLAGLAVSSQDPARVCTAVFDQVSILPGPAPVAAPSPVVGQGDGLRAQYFQNLDFTGEPAQRIDKTINFEWRSGEPVAGINRRRFSARWEGEIQAQFTEPYAFHLIADDRARLWLNGKLIIDDFIPHAPVESAMRMNLVAGQKYLVRVEYFQHGQDAVAKLLWSSPSTPKQIVPQTQLSSAAVDSDSDGMPDLWELDYGLKPQDSSDAAADPDEDGLTNLQEYLAGKSPRLADSYTEGLPEPWRGADIGTPLVKGNAGHLKGYLSITSAGADIWGNLDSFHFVHQTLKGDGEIVARVVSLQNTDPWAKACVMFRAKLTDDSRHVMLAFTPEKGISFQYRSLTAGATTDEWGGPATPPRWIKIVRRGNRFNGFRSDNGQTWEWVASEQIELPEEAFVGLAVSSHVPGVPTTALFDSVSLNPLSAEEAPKPFLGSGDGLFASYYDVITKTNITRIDPMVDFNWGTGSPHTNIGRHYFSARWEGMIQAQFSETYALHVITDDGLRLWVDGQQVIDAWSDRAATKMTAKLPLLAGHKYLIKLEYYERVGEAAARLHWSSPSTPKQPVPQAQLYSPQHPEYAQVEDKDHDGMPDVWEQIYGLNDTEPADAGADPDQDDLTNLQEYLAGTNPLKADTDGDGIPDGSEVQHGLNPNDAGDALADADHDGLTNRREFQAGTNPNKEDTDGDGLTDAMEVLETATNPLTNDIREIVTVVERSGAEAQNRLGKWTQEGSALFAEDRRGALEYTLTTTAANMYRIELEGGSHNPRDGYKNFQFLIWVDGEYLGRCHLVRGEANSGRAHIFTPWLAPGDHVVRIFWDNAAKDRSLKVDAVRLQALHGSDENKNGISDWTENRLKATCGIELQGQAISNGARIQSVVSPACIEGRGSYLTLMQLSGGVGPRRGPGDRWYADVPLSIAPENLTASFQNGGSVQTNQLAWQPTNVRESGDLTIRKGDALLFVMRTGPEDVAPVRIDVAGLTNFAGTASAVFPCRFDEAGQYVITGTSVPPSGAPQVKTITIQVIAGKFDDRPAAWADKSRLWSQTHLPPGAVLDTDPRLSVQPLPGSDDIHLFGLALHVEEPHWVAARVGPGGSILDNTAAEGFRLYSSSQTDLKIIQTFEDGSQLIEMALVSTPVLPQVSVHIDLVVAGIIFEDGTISKVLSAKDFNALGEARVRFIRPESARTSVCHKTRVYQGGVFLGIHR